MRFEDELEDRSSSVLEFIKNIEDEERKKKERDEIENNPEFKMRRLEASVPKCQNELSDEMLARLFVNATPIDDDYKLAHSEELLDKGRDFFKDKGSLVYIREGLGKNKSPLLKKFVEGVESIAKDDFRDKGNNITLISPEDLDYKFSEEDGRKLDQLSSDLEFDDIAEVIKQNVIDTTVSEIEGAKEEDEIRQEIEDELTTDDSVATESAIERALFERGIMREKFHTPSLFEAIMVNKTRLLSESTDDKDIIMGEAVLEYTLLEMTNVLGLDNIKMKNGHLDDMINSYLR